MATPFVLGGGLGVTLVEGVDRVGVSVGVDHVLAGAIAVVVVDASARLVLRDVSLTLDSSMLSGRALTMGSCSKFGPP
jgi:hypothetical protein